jgi:hypothetical protein
LIYIDSPGIRTSACQRACMVMVTVKTDIEFDPRC